MLVGGLIFLMVMGYTSLMDGSKWALAFEALRVVYLVLIYLTYPSVFMALGLPYALLIGLSAVSVMATKWALTDE